MDKEKIVETISDVGGSTTSALVGAGIGAAIAGPVGIAGGAIAGTAIEKVFQRIGEEIKNRVLSKSENEKIETVYECAKLYNQPTTTFTPLETVQTGACTYKIFVYKSADISYNESAML